MAQAQITTTGGTIFEYSEDGDGAGKVKITTAEGASLIVPLECLAKFVYNAYVVPQRTARASQKEWREGLLGP